MLHLQDHLLYLLIINILSLLVFSLLEIEFQEVLFKNKQLNLLVKL